MQGPTNPANLRRHNILLKYSMLFLTKFFLVYIPLFTRVFAKFNWNIFDLFWAHLAHWCFCHKHGAWSRNEKKGKRIRFWVQERIDLWLLCEHNFVWIWFIYSVYKVKVSQIQKHAEYFALPESHQDWKAGVVFCDFSQQHVI